MARLKRPTNETSSPVTQYLNWKSNDKAFAYYDKAKSENVLVELPIKILFLEHYHTVKGWNDASESGIFSNEVYSIGSEPLTVKAFKGGEIATGLYKEIKESIKNAGAVYNRSIYAMTSEGALINISLKGSGVKAYSDFYNDNNHLLDNSWIEINSAKEGKKGAVKYTTPEFTLGSPISKDENKMADEVANSLQAYMNSYFGRDDQEATVEATVEVSTEDMPF